MCSQWRGSHLRKMNRSVQDLSYSQEMLISSQGLHREHRMMTFSKSEHQLEAYGELACHPSEETYIYL